MKLIDRALLAVNPADAEMVDGFYSMDYMFGASNESTIRYGYVKQLPKGRFKWLKEGDKIWFTQQLGENQIFDENNLRGCIIFPQEQGEIWGVTELHALRCIRGIERDGVVKSTPNYLACLPMVERPESKHIIIPDTAEKEWETRAECIEDKEGYKKGDLIHFKINTDYPAKTMKSEWVKRDGKRVLFLDKEFIFGKERGNKFYKNKHWCIVKALDEGDGYDKMSSGIFIPQTEQNKKDIAGKAELLYNHGELKKGDVIKHAKRGFNSFELHGEKVYGTEDEYIWLKYD